MTYALAENTLLRRYSHQGSIQYILLYYFDRLFTDLELFRRRDDRIFSFELRRFLRYCFFGACDAWREQSIEMVQYPGKLSLEGHSTEPIKQSDSWHDLKSATQTSQSNGWCHGCHQSIPDSHVRSVCEHRLWGGENATRTNISHITGHLWRPSKETEQGHVFVSQVVRVMKPVNMSKAEPNCAKGEIVCPYWIGMRWYIENMPSFVMVRGFYWRCFFHSDKRSGYGGMKVHQTAANAYYIRVRKSYIMSQDICESSMESGYLYSTANLRPRGLWYVLDRAYRFLYLTSVNRSVILRRGTRVEIRPSRQMSVEQFLAEIHDGDFVHQNSHPVRTTVVLVYTPGGVDGNPIVEITIGSFFPLGQRELITEITLDAGATYMLRIQGPRYDKELAKTFETFETWRPSAVPEL